MNPTREHTHAPKRLHRRTVVRLISYSLALFVVLGGFAAAGWMEAAALRQSIEQDYQQSFFELAACMSQIDNALQKGLCSTSPSMFTQLAGEVSREAATAQAALARLPVSFAELDRTARFLSQAGDYVSALSRLAAAGQPLDDKSRESLRALSVSATSLAGQLNELQGIINEENLSIGEIAKAENVLSNEEKGLTLFAGAFKDLAQEFPETPSLIYDGPFSEHLDKRVAVFLEKKPEVTAEQAMRSALDFTGLSDGQLALERENGGRIPTYSFVGRLDGGELSVDITKRGGYVLRLLNSRTPGEPQLDAAQAIEKATAFLSERGFSHMKESYWINNENVLLVNFAYQQDDVLCYPDLIKVGIALDTGKVVQVEAFGYMMNHVDERTVPDAKITLEQAVQALSKDLTFGAAQICIVPTAGEHEVLCYELTCTNADGIHVLVYTNVETGAEEKILILMEDENGTLAQ